MTLGEQIEDTAKAGIGLVPTVSLGIGMGIIISVVPVVLFSIGLRITDSLFNKVVN